MQELVVEITDELREQLRDLASRGDKGESHLIVEALEAFLAEQAWQIAEIEQGLVEAEEGLFVDQEEAEALLKKFIL
ncbi:MAG: hypothetical protein HYV26_19155 [Candidatus Hydrogenedentes bacterium]|nr:hypothetical protein [Candidatus Hydrogenedentota bacterium]MBI3117528.1 hypothetical protein [Candidatus Hydrogenedentota bacterium]